jgi:hypothetical protein
LRLAYSIFIQIFPKCSKSPEIKETMAISRTLCNIQTKSTN